MSSNGASSNLHDRAGRALDQPFLRRAVRFTADRLRDAKATGEPDLDDWEAWRDAARSIRERTLARLDVHLARFRRELEARGGHVHFAEDAAEACAITTSIAARRGARLVAKSKSMVSEEIHLNSALEKAGIEALETDLGEWIVQLARETPAHIILPAIHKSRAEVRKLFETHGKTSLADDTATLAAYARRELRAAFLRADVGISGCNFAVAETGSIAIFTNEGNGRMVTTLPRVHVVLMGMERIVPTLAELATLTRMLPRSATGQRITTYLNLISGPRRTGEVDGPEELHVVILDNGRMRILGDPVTGSVLDCIRCGACLNVCPVYRQIGGHAYGSIYPGPIGAVLTPLLAPDDPCAAELPQASSLCGACRDACPVKIPLDHLLVHLRARAVERGITAHADDITLRVAARVLASPTLFGMAGRVARRAARFARNRPRFVAFVKPLREWSHGRELPDAPAKSFSELWPELERELGGRN